VLVELLCQVARQIDLANILELPLDVGQELIHLCFDSRKESMLCKHEERGSVREDIFRGRTEAEANGRTELAKRIAESSELRVWLRREWNSQSGCLGIQKSCRVKRFSRILALALALLSVQRIVQTQEL
jgi:hypothetical protein